MPKSSSSEMHFRGSLRDAATQKSPPCKLHRGCSGHLHGQGVLKVKSKVDPPPCQRSLAARDSRSSSRSPVCYDRTTLYDRLPTYSNNNNNNNNNNSSSSSMTDSRLSYVYNNSREADDSCYNSSSDVESSPIRKKSMLGLGKVLPAATAESKSILPPRSPPKFLAFSTRSLSSSTCSSDQSSSSRYSGSPSPGIHDSYNNPLQWPFSAAAASSGLFLEEVSEELDDDLDQWSDQHNNRRPSPSPSPCSTLASSTYESSIDQGRRLAMSPHQLRHSTPNRSPYTERNRPSNSSSSSSSKSTLPIRRSTVNSGNNINNNSSSNGPGSYNKGASSNSHSRTESSKKRTEKITSTTPLIKNKRVADLKSNVSQSSSRCSSPSLSRQVSVTSSRSSLNSQKTTDSPTTTSKRLPLTLTATTSNNKQRTIAAKPKSPAVSLHKIASQNRTGSKQLTPPTPEAKKDEDEEEEVVD